MALAQLPVRLPPRMRSESENPKDALSRSQHESHQVGADGSDVDSDKSLMERVRDREQPAMTVVFDRYAGLVYSVALRVLNDSGQAEDVMQEIFLQLWRNPVSFSSTKGSLAPWLAVVARNRAIDQLRQRKPTEVVDEVVLASPANLESEAERNTMMHRVRGILREMPEEHQRSLEMAFFEGLTHSEIAAKTGQPLGTIKTRIRSALISLRKRLEA
jgi:RNA polymerase sigma-70 factor, ECF subfamily